MIRICLWCFARVVVIYPRAFRARFGGAMLQAFRDGLCDRHVRLGLAGVAAFAIPALLNLLASGIAERRFERRRHARARTREPFRAALQDVRFAMRMMRRQRGVTLLGVLTLGVGLGAATAVFSVVDASLLRPIALPDPDRLVVVLETSRGAPSQVSYENLLDWKREARPFAALAGFRAQNVNLTGLDTPNRVRGAFVTHDFFRVAGVTPAIGRSLRPADDETNGPAVVVISHGVWQRHFGGRADIIDRTVQLNNIGFTIVGVMPADFRFPFDGAEVWMPARFVPGTRSRGARTMTGFGRLRPDATIDEARADLGAIASALAREHPSTNADSGAAVEPLHEWLTAGVDDQLGLVFGLVLVLLAAACANVTSLQVSATAARRGEIAIRVALGAGRQRIARQLFTEHILLASAGGALGIVLARVLVPMAVTAAPVEIFGLHRASVADSRVLLFAFALTVVAGLSSGLIPALHWAGRMPSALLAGSGRTVADRHLNRAHVWLVAGQVAMAALLLATGGFLLKSYAAIVAVDPGFDVEALHTLEYRLPSNKYRPADQSRFHDDVVRRVATVPGVRGAAGVRALPLSGNGNITEYRTERMPADAEPASAELNTVTDEYFRLMGIPLLRGRTFDSRDTAEAPMVVVVSRTLAEREWPGEDPTGRLMMPVGMPIRAQVIGVVDDVRHRSLVEDGRATCYVRNAQNPGIFMTLVARIDGSPNAMAAAIRRAVWEVDPDQPVWKERSLESLLRASSQGERFLSAVLAIFSGAALVLVVAGLYGVLSRSVSGRVREIGLRMALGASRTSVLNDVLRSGLRMTLAGLIAGLGVSALIARLMRGLLYRTSPLDAAPFVLTTLLLIVVALIACYLPARRAASVDPARALRAMQ